MSTLSSTNIIRDQEEPLRVQEEPLLSSSRLSFIVKIMTLFMMAVMIFFIFCSLFMMNSVILEPELLALVVTIIFVVIVVKIFQRATKNDLSRNCGPDSIISPTPNDDFDDVTHSPHSPPYGDYDNRIDGHPPYNPAYRSNPFPFSYNDYLPLHDYSAQYPSDLQPPPYSP